MDPSRNQLLHLSEGEDESEEEEESYGGGHGFQQLQQCRRRKGGMKDGLLNQEMQRVKVKRGKGEVVHVVNGGGRIVRATGRKDRHSKVCTARGTRDRRVRLSPNTAIQFYDVQDRLGYDRPSKAIDWLMKEAKAEIDALNAATALQQQQQQQGLKQQCLNDDDDDHQQQQQQFLNGCSNPSSSVFPMEENAVNEPNSVSFQDIFFFDDQRLISWSAANPENGKPEDDQSFTNLTHHFPPVIAQNQVFSQREPLQSSLFPHSFSYATMGFANNDLSGLSAARRIHGEHAEEHHHLTSGRPAAAAGTPLLDYQH